MNRRLTVATVAASGIGLLVPALRAGQAVEVETVVAQAQPPAATAAASDSDPLHGLLQATADRGAAAAHATLRIPNGTRVGEVSFFADPRGGGTVVVATLDLPDWLKAGNAFHGFHVHANDDPSNGNGCQADPEAPRSTWFASADGHLKAGDQTHGRHRGDLPALYLRRGGASEAVAVTDKFRPRDVVGRAVILHADPDNFGNVPVGSGPEQYDPNSPAATELTAKTGNAGNRIACGVIRGY